MGNIEEKMTGAEAIVKFLERAGVEYVFGLCGHANLSMLDALERSNIEFISVRNEQNASHMADAYYRFSHKPGVVLTTIGPGLGNAVNGIWESAMDCSGVIIISGNVPSYMSGKDAFQELSIHSDSSQGEIYRPITKRVWKVAAAESIPFICQRAYNISMYGRPGPVLIDVPMDFLSEINEYKIPNPMNHVPHGIRIRGDKDEIEKAAKLLVDAEKPIIHAGNGAVLSGASSAIVELAEYLGIPVTTSMLGQGIIDNTHVLSGGYPGVTGTATGNKLTNEADLVLSIGTRFSELESSSWNPEYSFQIGYGGKHIQVDIDPHEIGRIYPVDVGIIGDAATVVEEILFEVKKITENRDWNSRQQIKDLIDLKNQVKNELSIDSSSDNEPILVQRVIGDLGKVVPDENILVSDAGTFRHAVGQFYPIRKPQSLFLPSGLGTMGGSASAAIGAKLAQPHKTVVCLIGDGGISANDNALATAVENNIPVVYVVLNNYSWDSIETYQHIHFKGRVYGTQFKTKTGENYNPDFCKLAEAYGVESIKVTSPQDLILAYKKAFESNKPFLIEVIVDKTKIKSHGKWEINDFLKNEGEFKAQRDSIIFK